MVRWRVDGGAANKYLQDFADTRAAWKVIIKDMGIDPETMKKVAPPTSPVLEHIEGLTPEPIDENVDKLQRNWGNISIK